MTKRRWIWENWKLGFHLVMRTRRFGVNNERWPRFDSMFGYPLWKIVLRVLLVYPLIREYRRMKARTTAAHLLSSETRRMLWSARETAK